LEAASPGKEQGTNPQESKSKEIKDNSGSCIYITDPQGLLKSSRPNLLGSREQEYPRGSTHTPLKSPQGRPPLTSAHLVSTRELYQPADGYTR